jgi:molybdopterin molybdotransferase
VSTHPSEDVVAAASEVAPPGGASRAAGGSGALLSVEAARDAVLATAGPVDTERLAVADALGRVIAETAIARVSLPPWPNSAMDGYAILAADTLGASEGEPVRLEIIGDIRAGAEPDVVVRHGTGARIATGAPLPAGADAVVPVEDTTPLDAIGAAGPRGRDATGPVPAACLVHESVNPGGSVRAAGSDLTAGAVLVGPGRGVTPAALSLLAGAGVSEILVYCRPRIGVLATGDEVRAPGEDLGPAGIPDANGPGLRALVTFSGAEPADLGIARDDLRRLRHGLDARVDAIVVSGGVSVGPYDVVKTALETIGRIDLWRVAVQPGKPFTFGTAPRPRDGPPVLLFGLPGNPVSSAVTFELFVRPAIRKLAGRTDLLRPVDRAVLGEPVTKSHGRRAFVRVEAEHDGEGGPIRDAAGRVLVHLAGGQGSHVISALAAADGLAVIPEDQDTVAAGSEVALWWLDRA